MPALRQTCPSAAPRDVAPEPDRCALCEAFGDAAPVRSRLAPGEDIFRQGDRARRVYRIVEGAAVSFRLLADGRRHVTEFHLAGDFLGLETGLDHHTSAQALGPVTVVAVRRAELSELARTNSDLARALWQMSMRAYQRSEDHALILGRQGATERVAAFLLDYADRVGASEALDLPMTRQDMADHLGLTIHTVSRTLSQLQAEGLIEARSSRHVELLRRDRLERICS